MLANPLKLLFFVFIFSRKAKIASFSLLFVCDARQLYGGSKGTYTVLWARWHVRYSVQTQVKLFLSNRIKTTQRVKENNKASNTNNTFNAEEIQKYNGKLT